MNSPGFDAFVGADDEDIGAEQVGFTEAVLGILHIFAGGLEGSSRIAEFAEGLGVIHPGYHHRFLPNTTPYTPYLAVFPEVKSTSGKAPTCRSSPKISVSMVEAEWCQAVATAGIHLTGEGGGRILTKL